MELFKIPLKPKYLNISVISSYFHSSTKALNKGSYVSSYDIHSLELKNIKSYQNDSSKTIINSNFLKSTYNYKSNQYTSSNYSKSIENKISPLNIKKTLFKTKSEIVPKLETNSEQDTTLYRYIKIKEAYNAICKRSLFFYSVGSAIPMVGFGLMDNIVMITVGEFIDSTIGLLFGFATLTAAALGQICSDITGICFGGIVKNFAQKLGLPSHNLTPLQKNQPFVKIIRTFSMCIGVTIGCLLGMLTLLIVDADRAEKRKAMVQAEEMFDLALAQAASCIEPQRCRIYLLDRTTKTLVCMAKKSIENFFGNVNDPENMSAEEYSKIVKALSNANNTIRPVEKNGIKGTVLLTGVIQNIPEVQENSNFIRNRYFDILTGYYAKSVLVIPLYSKENEVVGVIEMINKRPKASKMIMPFDKEDVILLELTARYIEVYIQVNQIDAETWTPKLGRFAKLWQIVLAQLSDDPVDYSMV